MIKKDTRFKKGQSGNPSGKPKLIPELVGVKPLTKEEVARIIGKYSRMTYPELMELTSGASLPAIDMVIVNALKNAIKDGDLYKLGFLLERTIGKVTDKVETELSVKQVEVTRENLAELYAAAKGL